MSTHPALTEGRVAVVTGAASGIGLAAARRFASMGLKVCLADLSQQALELAMTEIVATSPEARTRFSRYPPMSANWTTSTNSVTQLTQRSAKLRC